MKNPLLPTSDLAKRLCAIYHRRLDTPWQPRTVQRFRHWAPWLERDTEAVDLLERYYKANWPPNQEKNYLRHDFKTFINNLDGEVDRARIWCERHPLRKERKIIPMPPARTDEPAVTADPECVQRFLSEYQARKQAKGAPR